MSTLVMLASTMFALVTALLAMWTFVIEAGRIPPM